MPEYEHRRRSIRLTGYDYRSAGAYFVTICTHGRECLLGEVVDGAMAPNRLGRVVERAWYDLPARFPGIALDAFVVMPNHVHGIVRLVGAPLAGAHPAGADPAGGVALGDVVGAFKSLTTRAMLGVVREAVDSPIVGPLWQRNYYEHIVRDDDELERIRAYIVDNPMRWDDDDENLHEQGHPQGVPLHRTRREWIRETNRIDAIP
jgi:REP element-mobilizing transposase RayT